MTMDYEDYLKNWILTFLSTPQELLDGLPPCPFAKKSLLDNKIKFVKGTEYAKEIAALFDSWDNQFDVVVYVAPDDVSKDTFVNDISNLNNIYLEKGFVCLEDHVDIPEPFFNLKFNNGKYNIVLCQKTDIINQSSIFLLNQGYYKNWSQELYNNVVAWRLFPTNS